MNSYSLIVRPNSFVQIWFTKGQMGDKQVTHTQTSYVDMEGNISQVVGPKKKEDGPTRLRGPGRPPSRRSPRARVAQKSHYVDVSPARDLGDLDQILGANLGIQGNYDNSVDTT